MLTVVIVSRGASVIAVTPFAGGKDRSAESYWHVLAQRWQDKPSQAIPDAGVSRGGGVISHPSVHTLRARLVRRGAKP